MPGDLIVSNPSIGPAPKETTVPAGSRYIVKQVQALYTDNGAAGAWLPALEIVSDAGIVTGRYVGESVAAGSNQEVTFFPLGRKGASAAPAAGLTFAIAYVNRFNIPTAPTGSFANFDPWDKIDASDANLTLNGSGQVVFGAAGLYRCEVGLQILDNVWLGTDTLDFNFLLLTGGAGNSISTTWPGKTTTVAPNNPSGASRVWELSAEVWVNIVTPGEATRQQVLSVTGGAAHTATSTFAVMSVQRVGAATSGGVS